MSRILAVCALACVGLFTFPAFAAPVLLLATSVSPSVFWASIVAGWHWFMINIAPWLVLTGIPSLITGMTKRPKLVGFVPLVQAVLRIASWATHRDDSGTFKFPLTDVLADLAAAWKALRGAPKAMLLPILFLGLVHCGGVNTARKADAGLYAGIGAVASLGLGCDAAALSLGQANHDDDAQKALDACKAASAVLHGAEQVALSASKDIDAGEQAGQKDYTPIIARVLASGCELISAAKTAGIKLPVSIPCGGGQ